MIGSLTRPEFQLSVKQAVFLQTSNTKQRSFEYLLFILMLSMTSSERVVLKEIS